MLEHRKIKTDLCVIGGGLAGICTAVSAAREGISVVLMHERAVLGGNASSEIRMWVSGAFGENNRETGILEELFLENAYRNPGKSYAVWDTVLYELVKKEKNITLLLNCTCMDAKTEKGSFADRRNTRIKSVSGYQMTTQAFFDVEAELFSDCSGDSILAPLTGAEFMMGREGCNDFGENTVVEKADSLTMGMSCLIGGRETAREIKYTPPSFATKLAEENFVGRDPDLYKDTENFWYLELGGDRDSIADTETVRDELLGLAVGTWDYIKNSGKFDSERWELDFLGFLPGKRESRRMVGEYIITERDISLGRVFEDEIAFGGWPLDDHFPGGFYHRGVPNTYYETPAPYSIPYRALYSKNVENLFFAGRNISMTHTAMSSIRVMATCALLGEAVGRAAAIALKYRLTPNGVYRERISELQGSLLRADCFLPSKKREISNICKAAELNGPELLRNGEDRAHIIYGTNERDAYYRAKEGESITYKFEKRYIESIHIVFDSDLNRNTLDGSVCERTRSTRMNFKLDAPIHRLPKTLCKKFEIYGELDGESISLLSVDNNRKRAYNIAVGKVLDSITLTVNRGWGEDGIISLISFDFC